MAKKNPKLTAQNKKLSEALEILEALGLPSGQQNERSALTFLALLGLKLDDKWSKAGNPLMGITPMMEFFARHYGKKYAANTRETVRRFTVHQFLQAGLIAANPDLPTRPTNSPKAVYQIEANALKLIRLFKKQGWTSALGKHLASVETLKKTYARERKMTLIPIKLASGKKIALSPGGQNVLIKKIVEEFCPRFAPGCNPVYVGDTAKKWAYFDKALLDRLGVVIDEHGKIPDVIVYFKRNKWLILIEAVTSHGPVNPKRRTELKALFKGCKAPLVIITAFSDRGAMVKYLSEISWETDVWVADSPTHLIHFNGDRFLGPYKD